MAIGDGLFAELCFQAFTFVCSETIVEINGCNICYSNSEALS